VDSRDQQKLIAMDAGVPAQRATSSVLADRMAAALVHREPGWQLPRRSALARRYNVSMAEVDAALDELTRRSLVRGRPGGQLYRASPAEYLIPVEGVGRLSTRLDPMGTEISRQARHISHRDAPQDVASALGAGHETQVRVIRCVWTAGSEPVAISMAYLLGVPATALGEDDDPESLRDVLAMLPGSAEVTGPAVATAVDLELAPPQPSVARSLRLTPGEPAISVTIRFEDPDSAKPTGLSMVVLKPGQFRVIIKAADELPRLEMGPDTEGA
jgi:DNA-binding GntR family transcriptional regulator